MFLTDYYIWSTCRLEVETSEVCFVLWSCFAAQLLSAGIVSPVRFTSKAQNHMVWVSVKKQLGLEMSRRCDL